MNEEQITHLENAAETLIEVINQAGDAGSYVAAIDHVISMRKANERERALYTPRF